MVQYIVLPDLNLFMSAACSVVARPVRQRSPRGTNYPQDLSSTLSVPCGAAEAMASLSCWPPVTVNLCWLRPITLSPALHFQVLAQVSMAIQLSWLPKLHWTQSHHWLQKLAALKRSSSVASLLETSPSMRRRSGHGPNNSFKPTPHRGVGHVPALR